LDVVTDGHDGFLGILADEVPDGPPLPLQMGSQMGSGLADSHLPCL
jgi:hypothetical protein